MAVKDLDLEADPPQFVGDDVKGFVRDALVVTHRAEVIHVHIDRDDPRLDHRASEQRGGLVQEHEGVAAAPRCEGPLHCPAIYDTENENGAQLI